MSLRTKIRGLKEVWQFDNRLWLMITKALFPHETLHVYRYKGLDILTDHGRGDANGAREILTSPMYRRYLPKMILNAPASILDLGASNGGFPLLLQASGVRLKKILSIELNPQTFIRLRFNLERNLNCQIVALHAALCGETKMLEVAVGKGSVSDDIYGEDARPGADVCNVQGLSLDDIIDTYFRDEIIDICKMDVEGAEFEVFLQPSHAKLRQCRYILMEIHERGNRRASEILPVIEKLGFVRPPPDADADPTVHFFVNSAVQVNR